MSIYSTNADIIGKIKLSTSSKIVFGASSNPDFSIDNSEENGWIDINMPIIITGTGSNDPTIASVTGLTRMQLYTFPGSGAMKQCWSQIHIPHNYAIGTGIYFHAHVLTDAAVLTGNYKINFDYSYASSGNVFSAVQTVSVTDNFTNTLQHKITEISSPVLTANLEVDGVVMIRMWRDPSDVSDTFAGDVHLLYIDCHMNVSKFSTKYRNKLTTGSFYA